MKESVDFNDAHVNNGLDQTKAVIVSQAENKFKQQAPSANDSFDTEDSINDDLLNPPPELHPDGLHGILKEACRISTKDSEASGVAIAANIISTFSAMIGRVAYQGVGDAECHARPFFLLTGRTGKARKGTSEYTPYRIAKEAENMLGEDYPKLARHTGGLSTGEGLGYAIHDDVLNKDGEISEAGIKDKRLYVVEAEFASCMAAASREKNNLSGTVRNLWDGREISPLVKNSKWCASDPHIVITGHITSAELIDRMRDVDARSGFINRFVILHIVRPKLVPLPKRTPEDDIKKIAINIAEAIEFATGGGELGNNELEVTLSPEAAKYWCGEYESLTQEQGGIVGDLLVRTEIYCRMLAMIFALLDCSNVIEPQHIKAALAWIDYWKKSVSYIFGTLAAKAESNKLNEDAKVIYEYICENSGCTKTELTKHFKHKLNGVLMTSALNHLSNAAPPLIRQETKPRANKKPGKGTTVFYKV